MPRSVGPPVGRRTEALTSHTMRSRRILCLLWRDQTSQDRRCLGCRYQGRHVPAERYVLIQAFNPSARERTRTCSPLGAGLGRQSKYNYAHTRSHSTIAPLGLRVPSSRVSLALHLTMLQRPHRPRFQPPPSFVFEGPSESRRGVPSSPSPSPPSRDTGRLGGGHTHAPRKVRRVWPRNTPTASPRPAHRAKPKKNRRLPFL